jgi:CDGSH-type Zn-finger protein
VTLCRCGASQNKPFCNGSHATIKFKDGFLTEKA